MDHPTILTCAVTGNLTTPQQTSFLAITPSHIAEECLAAAEAGAPRSSPTSAPWT